MNLAALPVHVTRATNEPEMHFSRHQRNSQRSTFVVVITGDGEQLTSAPSSVAKEMLPVRTELKNIKWWLNLDLTHKKKLFTKETVNIQS